MANRQEKNADTEKPTGQTLHSPTPEKKMRGHAIVGTRLVGSKWNFASCFPARQVVIISTSSDGGILMHKYENTNGTGPGIERAAVGRRPLDRVRNSCAAGNCTPKSSSRNCSEECVFMPSPLSRQHGVTDRLVSGWLCVYHASTPGTEGGNNAITLLGGDEVPQPDAYLPILPAANRATTASM